MPNRIEREIEEILTRLDEFVPNESRGRRVRRRMGQGVRGLRRLRLRLPLPHLRVSGGHLVLGAALMLLVAQFLPGSLHSVSRIMIWAGVAIIFGAIFVSIRPVRRGARNRYWRGQPVDVQRRQSPSIIGRGPSTIGPGPFMRLRMWWRRHNRFRR